LENPKDEDRIREEIEAFESAKPRIPVSKGGGSQKPGKKKGSTIQSDVKGVSMGTHGFFCVLEYDIEITVILGRQEGEKRSS